jgi:hypothetical protein
MVPFDRLELNTPPEKARATPLYVPMGFECCDPYVDEPLEGVLYYCRFLQVSDNCVEL